jgi:flagellar assembly factor FliW
MEVLTTRFGRIEFAADDILRFSEGLPGLTDCREWVLLADPEDDAVVWMQSISRPEIALAAVSPRRFVPHYQLRVCRRELEPLALQRLDSACVLAVVSKSDRGLSINLRGPLVIDTDRRVGRQVIAHGDAPVQYWIPTAAALRKSA